MTDRLVKFNAVKSLCVQSLKVSSASLLLLSLWVSDGYAMEPDERGSFLQGRAASPTLHIISPEAVKIEQQLQQHAQQYPHIASSNPKIQTLEDFKNAKVYLTLMEKYNSILQTVIMVSMLNPIAINVSLKYESALISYALTLLGRKNSSSFYSAQDEENLRRIFYAAHYRLGIARLEDFFVSQSSLPLDDRVKKMEAVHQIFFILSQSADQQYATNYQKYIKSRTAASFSVVELNSPFVLANPTLRNSILGEQEEVRRTARGISSAELENSRESYDFYFCTKSYSLAVQFNDILNESLPNASELLKNNMQSYFELEKEGLRFKSMMETRKTPEKDIILNEKSLKEFYDFLTQRLKHLPNRNPIEFLPHIILSLMAADQKREALERLTVLEYLLLKKGALSQNFIIFRAKIKAMCSDFEELNHLYANLGPTLSAQTSSANAPKLIEQQGPKKPKQNRHKKMNRRDRRAALFAASKEPSSSVDNNTSPQPSVLPDLDAKHEMIQEPNELAESELVESLVVSRGEPDSSKPSLPSATEVAEESSPAPQDVRIDPTKAAHTQRESRHLSSFNEAASAKKSSPPQPAPPPLKEKPSDFFFSFRPKSFKILNQLFSDDWAISRENIESFFEEVGQEVNTKTASSHHIIRISEGIAMIKEGQTIGMISDLSANMEGHISLPRWDKTVPLYIRKDVIRLIDLMGITKDNYKKGQDINYEAH